MIMHSSPRRKKTNKYSPLNIQQMSIQNMQNLHINFNITKNTLIEIIQFIFIKYGEFTVFGYNSKKNEFWAKKMKQNKCLLYFTLSINDYFNNDCSIIVIKPITGEISEFKKVINLIQRKTNLYK